MPEIVGRVKSALMLDRPVPNLKATVSDLFAHGPITAVVGGVDRVWNTMGQRVDNIAGTHISSGGPLH